MRPIRPEDAEPLVHFHLSLSSGSIYRRYFSFHPELSDEGGRAPHPGRLRGPAGLHRRGRRPARRPSDATTGSRARPRRRSPSSWPTSTSTTASDCCCSKHLADAARPLGITHFTAETQADNRGMLGVFNDVGLPGDVDDRGRGRQPPAFPIEPTEESRARYAGRRKRPAPGSTKEKGSLA